MYALKLWVIRSRWCKEQRMVEKVVSSNKTPFYYAPS